LKILNAQPLEEDASIPEGKVGEVFAWDETPAVIAGEGALVLSRLQMAGKRPMNGDAFLRGR
jgi:methionyl-tRNA formyltransferase